MLMLIGAIVMALIIFNNLDFFIAMVVGVVILAVVAVSAITFIVAITRCI